jgi:hypothetical protein
VGFGSLKRIEGMEIVIAYKNDLPQVFFKDDCMKRDRSTPLLFDKGRVCSPLPYFTSPEHSHYPKDFLTGRLLGTISVFL